MQNIELIETLKEYLSEAALKLHELASKNPDSEDAAQLSDLVHRALGLLNALYRIEYEKLIPPPNVGNPLPPPAYTGDPIGPDLWTGSSMNPPNIFISGEH